MVDEAGTSASNVAFVAAPVSAEVAIVAASARASGRDVEFVAASWLERDGGALVAVAEGQ